MKCHLRAGRDDRDKTQAPAAAERSVLLDALRGVAILLVLGCHYVIPPESAGVLSGFAVAWSHVGWSGVDLFFVLSGYLVSGLLFAEYKRTREVDLKRFAVRRAFKIWPSYGVYLGFLIAWLAYKSDLAAAATDLLPNLLHFQNYFGTPRLHTWSLAVEEHFYFVIALGFAWLARRETISVAAPCVASLLILATLIISVVRYAAFAKNGHNPNIYATHVRCDGLLFGTLLAHVSHFRPRFLRWLSAKPAITIAIGGALAAPVLTFTPDYNPWLAGPGLTALYIGYALIIQGLIAAQSAPRMVQALRSALIRPLAWIGVFSYGIYLWHVEFGHTPFKALARTDSIMMADASRWLVLTGGYIIAAILGGALMSKLVELPSLRLRDKLFPARTHAPLTPVAESAAPKAAVAAPSVSPLHSPILPVKIDPKPATETPASSIAT